jgi:hypothetical protein
MGGRNGCFYFTGEFERKDNWQRNKDGGRGLNKANDVSQHLSPHRYTKGSESNNNKKKKKP